jgi:hypothetical protein
LCYATRRRILSNAWNHEPDCTCGWGGEGHRGRSPGGYAISPIGCFRWQHRDEDFCRPTTCPRCRASVFFVRHNGGSVWFDELGHPWPKHACFADDRYGISLRRLLRVPDDIFGVIIETETTLPGKRGRVAVRCCDGSVINSEFDTTANLSLLIGLLVLVVSAVDGPLTLHIVNPAPPRKIAFWEIVAIGKDYRVVEQFRYEHKADADQRLSDLQAMCPDKYQIRYAKRRDCDYARHGTDRNTAFASGKLIAVGSRA